MFLRISSVALLLVATACGPAPENKVATAAPEDRIDCATGGAADFSKTCAIERDEETRIDCATSGAADFSKTCAIERGEGTRIVLRNADGGFRRIDIAADGTITAADGSDEADGKPLPDGRFELVLGRDRYRLPPRP